MYHVSSNINAVINSQMIISNHNNYIKSNDNTDHDALLSTFKANNNDWKNSTEAEVVAVDELYGSLSLSNPRSGGHENRDNEDDVEWTKKTSLALGIGPTI